MNRHIFISNLVGTAVVLNACNPSLKNERKSRPSDEQEDVVGYVTDYEQIVPAGETATIVLGSSSVHIPKGATTVDTRVRLRALKAPPKRTELAVLGDPKGEVIEVSFFDPETSQIVAEGALAKPYEFSQTITYSNRDDVKYVVMSAPDTAKERVDIMAGDALTFELALVETKEISFRVLVPYLITYGVESAEQPQGVTVINTSSNVPNGSGSGAEVPEDVTDNFAWSYPASNQPIITGAANFFFTKKATALSLNGNMFAVYRSYSPAGLFVSQKKDGTWIHPTLNAPLIGAAFQPVESKIATNRTGEAILAFRGYDGTGNPKIFVALYQNSTWSVPSGINNFKSLANLVTYDFDIAINDAGDAVLVYIGRDTYEQLYVSTYQKSSNTWTDPTGPTDFLGPASAGNRSYTPEVSIDSAGQIMVVWYQYIAAPPGNHHCMLAERLDGVWIKPSLATLAGFGYVNTDKWSGVCRLAANPTGQTVLAWAEDTDDSGYMDPRTAVYALERDSVSSSWKPRVTISPNADGVCDISAAIAANGDTTIGFSNEEDSLEPSLCAKVFSASRHNNVWQLPAISDRKFETGSNFYSVSVAQSNESAALIAMRYSGNGSGGDLRLSERKNNTWSNADLSAVTPAAESFCSGISTNRYGQGLMLCNQTGNLYLIERK